MANETLRVILQMYLVGYRYGRLVVVERASNDRHGETRWVCRCDCGEVAVVRRGNLRSGNTKSCGCLHRQRSAAAHRTHGRKGDPIYQVWWNMVQRCTNPNNPRWEYYGGRGITVCDRWMTFENFYEDIGERPPDLPERTGKRAYWSLDRIDNDSNYEPGNVRWATPVQQRANRRERPAS